MSTFVSKNTSSFMSVFAVERKAGRQCPAQLAEPTQRPVSRSVAPDLELALAGNDDLDLVAFLQFQRLDHCGGKANCPLAAAAATS